MSEMAPQPPPDAQNPPLPDVELPPIRWRLWIWSGVVLLTITSWSLIEGIYCCRDLYVKGRPRELTNAIRNMQQLGLALCEFESDYGSFPDDTTISSVRTNNPASTIPLGNATANDYFRQLLASGIVDTESIFHGYPDQRPDNNFDGQKALEKGECSFAYIKGVLVDARSAATPLVVFPLVRGKLVFDDKLCKEWQNKAVILRADCSLTTLPVDKSGHVYLNGKDLFDPSQPFWGGKVPDVKWPE